MTGLTREQRDQLAKELEPDSGLSWDEKSWRAISCARSLVEQVDALEDKLRQVDAVVDPVVDPAMPEATCEQLRDAVVAIARVLHPERALRRRTESPPATEGTHEPAAEDGRG